MTIYSDTLYASLMSDIEDLKKEISAVGSLNGCDDMQAVEDEMMYYIKEIKRKVEELKDFYTRR